MIIIIRLQKKKGKKKKKNGGECNLYIGSCLWDQSVFVVI